MKKKVYFKSCGVSICGILNEPKKKRLKDFVVVLCHGLGTRKTNKKNTALTKMLGRKGITTFIFDFYGHNESGGNFPDLTQTKAIKNVIDAVSFLRKKGFKRFGLMGSSFGGASAAGAAGKVNNLEFVCFVSPLTSYKTTWKRRTAEEYGVKEAFIEDGLKYNFFRIAKKIKVPALVVNGDKDTSTPLNGAKKFFERLAGEKMMVTIKGANHHYDKPKHQKDMINSIYNFILYSLPRE